MKQPFVKQMFIWCAIIGLTLLTFALYAQAIHHNKVVINQLGLRQAHLRKVLSESEEMKKQLTLLVKMLSEFEGKEHALKERLGVVEESEIKILFQ